MPQPSMCVRQGTLVLLIGIPASGKSTFARRHFLPQEIVSTDWFREMLTNDMGDQSANPEAFELTRRVVESRLRRGLTTVVDETSATAARRKEWVELASRHGAPVIGVVCDIPLDEALSANAQRGRTVPESAVRKIYADLKGSLPSIRDEGMDDVVILEGRSDMNALQILQPPGLGGRDIA